MASAFLSLTKIFVLAGLYDATRLPTWSVGSLMPLYLEGKAVEWLVGPAPLKAAYDKRNTLIRELGTAVMHPADLLGSAAKNIAQDYTSKWKRFKQAMRQTSLSATFEAGRISGEILVDVLMLIGTAAEIAKATKFLAEIPELVRLSKSIGAASGRGFAEEGNAAARFSEALAEGKPGTRRGAAPKEVVDAILPDAKRIPKMQFEGGAKDGGAAGPLLGAGVESGLGALAAGGDAAVSAIAAGGVPPALMAGRLAEVELLKALGSTGKYSFTPTQAQVDSAAFKVIVGDAKYTAQGAPVGTVYDAAVGGLGEIKTGTSVLDSSYQLRLQTYGSLLNDTPYTIYTSRQINTTFNDWLTRWGVSVKPLPK